MAAYPQCLSIAPASVVRHAPASAARATPPHGRRRPRPTPLDRGRRGALHIGHPHAVLEIEEDRRDDTIGRAQHHRAASSPSRRPRSADRDRAPGDSRATAPAPFQPMRSPHPSPSPSRRRFPGLRARSPAGRRAVERQGHKPPAIPRQSSATARRGSRADRRCDADRQVEIELAEHAPGDLQPHQLARKEIIKISPDLRQAEAPTRPAMGSRVRRIVREQPFQPARARPSRQPTLPFRHPVSGLAEPDRVGGNGHGAHYLARDLERPGRRLESRHSPPMPRCHWRPGERWWALR
jgi:hypothetical protein